MSWKLKPTDQWADRLRFIVRGAMFCNAILLSLASIYVTARVCWFVLRFLNRTIFSAPW